MQFIWDKGNWPHCGKHGVSMEEIEELFVSDPMIVPVKGVRTEERLTAIGATAEGRHMFVVFALRDGRIRPISARYMHAKEVIRYECDNS